MLTDQIVLFYQIVAELSGKILETLEEFDLLTDSTVLSWWRKDESHKKGKAMTICQAEQFLKWLEEEVKNGDQTDAPADNRK
jgi:hypothetical protein